MTSAQTDAAQRIFNAAVAGNSVNPGLPPALAQLLVGQSGNETGGWTSNFFINNNNCFGYECDPSSDWQDGCSSGNADNGVTVGNYDSIEDSTQELVDWIHRRIKDGKFPADLTTITTPTQYANLLSSAGYYTSSSASYAANISAWINKVGSLLMSAINGNPVAFAVAGILIIAGVFYGVKNGLFKKIKL